jgi:predicted phage terminase large subunit-like protein
MWPIIEPTQPYVHGWHIESACRHLEAAARFDLLELIINWPPRHMKSILVNVMFPAWVWAHKDWAGRKFMTSSYSASLAVRDGIKMRTIIESELYRQMFNPAWTLRVDQNQKLKFENTASGFRFSTSVGGAVTGEGADYLIVDDPINALESDSEVVRDETNFWWDIAWSTRANNPNAHCKIIIMQRLHENDLTGHVKSKIKRPHKRAHLIFQARYEPKSPVKSESPLPIPDPRTKEGELLWPERFDNNSIQQLAADLDTKGIGQSHAQLQQDPRPKSGSLFKRDWWLRYEKAPSSIHETIQFWDCAQKPGITNDWSVCVTWARCSLGYYMLDIWRGKVEAPTLEAMSVTKFQLLKPDAIVVEDKSAGSSLIQYLQRLDDPIIPVIAFQPRGDKEVRATAATPSVQAGKCFLPSTPIWGQDEVGNPIDLIEAFITEHERFPKAAHDDMVDTTSMMINYFAKRIPQNPRIRSL